ncbi:MAG: hypothetical protein K6V73_04310 [Firmicutes bacterium]|nr:hypothetical protein [Bacillota bacterium]
MRRVFLCAPGARLVPSGGRRLTALVRLRRLLTAAEYAAVRRLVGGMRHLPLDGGGEGAVMEHVLLAGDDEDVELLIKCERLLRDEGQDVDGSDPLRPPEAELADTAQEGAGARAGHAVYRFEAGARDLAPYLASLRRNGLRAVSLQVGDTVTVFVDIAGATDLEVARSLELARSLRELVARTAGRGLRGRRVGR